MLGVQWCTPQSALSMMVDSVLLRRTDLSRPLALVDDVQVPDALYKPEQ
jgi:hypothetical protein